MRGKKMTFGRLLIFLSFFIIIIGAIISIGETTGYVDTSNNIIVPHSDDKITISTTHDGKDLVVNEDGIVVSSDDDSTGNGSNHTSGGNNNNNNGNNSNNNGNGTGKTTGGGSNTGNNTTPVPSTPIPSTPSTPTPSNPVNTITQQNNSLRNSINSQYGIRILYGNETNGYSVAGLSTSIIYDENVINNELNTLKNNMAKYPSGFFRELTNSIPLTIYLVNGYSREGVCGVTDSSYERAIMSLAVGSDFVETFHHENYHYMERYIFKRNGDFRYWYEKNPDKDYDYKNHSYYPVYDLTFSPDVYFVNTYARDTDEFEDRASTFEYMMADSKASCLNYGMHVYHKAVYISEVIDNYFDTCSPGVREYWQRFL